MLSGYRQFWDAYLAAADPMNPQDPRLAEHATGTELETIQKAFLARKSAGEVIRGTFDLAPLVVTMDQASATVKDCYADHSGVYDVTTGARKDTESGVRHLVTAKLLFQQGTWKVADLTREGSGCSSAS